MATATQHSATPSAPFTSSVGPEEVGRQFVSQYYTSEPDQLHCFYTDDSTFSHGNEGEDRKPYYGQFEIHSKIMTLDYDNYDVHINSVDAQCSANNGVVIQVVGEMFFKGGSWKKFVQSFFLAEQANGYFVLNDIFRFLDRDSLVQENDQSEPTYNPQIANNPKLPASVESESTVITDMKSSPAVSASNRAKSRRSQNASAGKFAKAARPSSAPASPAFVKPKPTTKVPERSPVPSTPVELAPVKIPALTSLPVVAALPLPEKLSGPKTWAMLAANNTKKWGPVVADARSVAPATSSFTAPWPYAGEDGQHPAMQAALTVTTAKCFVKCVTEDVNQQEMRHSLTQQFGPIKDLEIIRSRACALLEFCTVEAARDAIVASLPHWQGGKGGIGLWGADPYNIFPRIIVEARKEW